MRTILGAVVFSLLATISAQAACPNIPDNASSGYVDNGALSVTYNLADVPNVMAFGLTVLVAALGTSEATDHA